MSAKVILSGKADPQGSAQRASAPPKGAKAAIEAAGGSVAAYRTEGSVLAANPNTIGKGGKFGDLKRRLWFLLGALIVYRIGAHIPVPGSTPTFFPTSFQSQQGGILGMFNMFSGGALSRFTIFALGIMPYISASIIMQLMSVASPQLEALKGARPVAENHPIHPLRYRWPGAVPGLGIAGRS